MGQLGITGAMHTTPTNAVEALICLPHWSYWYRARRGQLRNISGIWDAGLTYNPIEDRVVFWCSFCSQIPYLTWGLMLWGQHLILNPNTVLLCWLGKIGSKELVLPLQWRDSSILQMGPRWRREPGLQSMGSLWEEGSAQLFSRTICYSLSGRDICHLGVCLWKSISE
jgi:hypothetical protein